MQTTTIALVGCGKLKAQPKGNCHYIPARHLYISDLFQKRAKYMESRQVLWYITSAHGGLVKPGTVVAAYDKTITDMTEIERAEWHVGVANQLLTEIYYELDAPKLSSVVVELHAGERYREPLASILGLLGIKTESPTKGMGIGEQLAFYKSLLTKGPA